MSIRFKNTTKVTDAMKRSRKGAQSGAVRGVRTLMAEVYAESQVLVPVETGALKASGSVSESMSGSTFTATITYNTSYAVYVHEILRYQHAPPTQAKFVEAPWLALAAGKGLEVLKFYVGTGIVGGIKA